MKKLNGLAAALATGAFALCQSAAADTVEEGSREAASDGSIRLLATDMAKAASARSVASRATSTSSLTVYGGFELASSANVYILVRGNSLGTLGVTQGFLGVPRVRLYNSLGEDLITTGGRAGFNNCLTTEPTAVPVINYYQNVRGQAVHTGDACLAVNASAGAFTFSVTPSIPGVTTNTATSSPASGEILFEVTLGP